MTKLYEDTNDSELLMLYNEENEDAKNILYVKYKCIIDILISKYKKYLQTLGVDFNEVISECNVGFSDALRSYRESKDSSLPTFITICVERKMHNVIKKYSTDKYKIIHNMYSLDFDYDEDRKFIDILSDENDPLKIKEEEENYKELVSNIKSSLTKTENDVLSLMIRGLNYQEIAKILDKKPKQIDNTIQRVKNKIKKLIMVEN